MRTFLYGLSFARDETKKMVETLASQTDAADKRMYEETTSNDQILNDILDEVQKKGMPGESLTSIEGLQAAFGSMEQELKTRQFDFFTRMGAALLSEQSKADQLIKASTGESAIAAMGSQIKSVQDATVQMGDYISESMQAFQGFLPEAGTWRLLGCTPHVFQLWESRRVPLAKA